MPDLVIPHADYKNLLYLGPTPEGADWVETWESQAADYIDDTLLLLVHTQHQTLDGYFEIGRGMLFFDGQAHPLPTGAIVDLIKLRVWLNGKTNSTQGQYIAFLEPSNGAPHTPPITADFYYNNWINGPFAAGPLIDELQENQYNDIEMEGLIQDLAGMIRFYVILSEDLFGAEPGHNTPTIIDLAGRYDIMAAHRPELVLSYHLPTPPPTTKKQSHGTLLLGVY